MAGLFLANQAERQLSSSCPYQINCIVERNIDNEWYKARITMVDEEIEEVCLLYLDDGNKEDDVSFDEIRPEVVEEPCQQNTSTLIPCLTHRFDNEPTQRAAETIRTASSSTTRCINRPNIKDTLKKPLAGLFDDDSEARKEHVTTSIVHKCADTEEAIILNGAENQLAAGGGLRALRFIRKQGP